MLTLKNFTNFAVFYFRPNSFTIITANRLLSFCADTAEEANGWVDGTVATNIPKRIIFMTNISTLRAVSRYSHGQLGVN